MLRLTGNDKLSYENGLKISTIYKEELKSVFVSTNYYTAFISSFILNNFCENIYS